VNRPGRRDRGSVDVSIEMLFGMMGVLFALLALFEAGAYWHTRTILDDAASDGARVAAAYDGTCNGGVEVARAAVARQAGSWADAVDITCVDGPTVTVVVLGPSIGLRATASVSAPKER
jgi:Flp pilus assembly protein TadG